MDFKQFYTKINLVFNPSFFPMNVLKFPVFVLLNCLLLRFSFLYYNMFFYLNVQILLGLFHGGFKLRGVRNFTLYFLAPYAEPCTRCLVNISWLVG